MLIKNLKKKIDEENKKKIFITVNKIKKKNNEKELKKNQLKKQKKMKHLKN